MRGFVISRRHVLAGTLVLTATPALAVSSVTTIKAADGRSVRISIWPATGVERGVILFSHGAASSPEKYERLLTPWSQAGFRILAPLHVDSTDHPENAIHAKAMDSWRCRIEDMRALSAYASAPRYVAAGHSYGALTALTLGGAEAVLPAGVSGSLRDPRADVVLAFSPPGPVPTLITREGYSHLAVPALIATGTADQPPASMGGGGFQTHLVAFDAPPPGDKYALVLDGADHYFGGIICRPEFPGPPQVAAFSKAVAISTDFLEAYELKGAGARARLAGALHNSSGYTLTLKSA